MLTERISFAWNILVTFFATTVAVLLPLDLVFDLKDPLLKIYLDYLITFIFSIDIFLSLIRAHNYKPKSIIDNSLTLRNYLRSYFVPDIIAAFPFAVINAMPLLNILRLLKLIKIIHFMRNIQRREVQYSHILSLIFFVYWVMLAAHWISCGWLALRGLDYSMDYLSNYIRSLYWCITTLTTVGYGDVIPLNDSQTVYAMFIEILGVAVYGYLIGNIASILARKNPAKTNYLNNLKNLNALVNYRSISRSLQDRLREYYTYIYMQKLGYDETALLNELPKSLKEELALELKQEFIDRIDLFKGADPAFIKDVALHLKPIVLIPGDTLIREGEEGDEMYLVVRGELSVITSRDNEPIARLLSGDFFGEIALVMNVPRTSTIKALTYCDLYILNRATYNYIASKYPGIGEEIKKKAEQREKTFRDLSN